MNVLNSNELTMPAAVAEYFLEYLYDDNRLIKPLNSNCHISHRGISISGYSIVYVAPVKNATAREWLTEVMGVKHSTNAHRLSYLAHGGTLIKSQPVVRHLCGDKRCINPKHLCRGTLHDAIVPSVPKRRPAVRNTIAWKRSLVERLREGEGTYSLALELNVPMSLIRKYKIRYIENDGDINNMINCVG